jgi:predicted DNA-binding antitoxin AbrB/MazE fold protein
MVQVVKAVFENGVLRPLERLNLKENEHVQISVHQTDSGKKDGLKVTPADPLDGLRVATGIADLSENFDDYRNAR